MGSTAKGDYYYIFQDCFLGQEFLHSGSSSSSSYEFTSVRTDDFRERNRLADFGLPTWALPTSFPFLSSGYLRFCTTWYIHFFLY